MEGGEMLMIGKGKTQVWSNVPHPIKGRLEALKEVDPVLYSESRVIWQCLEAYLPTVEANAKSFKSPTQPTPSRRRRKS
jgi:hypothetical protein